MGLAQRGSVLSRLVWIGLWCKFLSAARASRTIAIGPCQDPVERNEDDPNRWLSVYKTTNTGQRQTLGHPRRLSSHFLLDLGDSLSLWSLGEEKHSLFRLDDQ